MRIDPDDLWRWLNGRASGDIAAAALLFEFVVHRFIRGARRKLESKVLDALGMGGGAGWGLTEDQVAGQHGWEPKKARSVLRRLERRGRVRQADGRWYLTPAKTPRRNLSS
jgi:hypothetical protein